MNTLICPLPVFQRLLRALAEDQRRIAFVRVGTYSAPPNCEWLVRSFILSPSSTPAPQQEPVFCVALTSNPLSVPLTLLSPAPLPPTVVGFLALGDGPWRGDLRGIVRGNDAIEPLHRLFLVGAGMHTIVIPNAHDQDPFSNPSYQLITSYQTRWSRTIGALGEAIWQRLVRLSIAIIGCGRTGSVVARTLTLSGIRQLTLIDPDVVETHNLGEMDGVTDADLGRPKAEALADHLRSLVPYPLSLFPIVAPITHPAALAAAKAGDVLVCCADNDAARLATALLATLYHKALVDIGTGIFYGATATRTMGADVRLILPGDGCLLCRGNLTDYAQAVDDLCHHRPPAGLQGEWSQQRAGSLRTVNQLAAALGVQMLQDLVAERLQASTWAHVEFDEVGHLTVHYPPTQRPSDSSTCALCAKAGLGDEGLRL